MGAFSSPGKGSAPADARPGVHPYMAARRGQVRRNLRKTTSLFCEGSVVVVFVERAQEGLQRVQIGRADRDVPKPRVAVAQPPRARQLRGPQIMPQDRV